MVDGIELRYITGLRNPFLDLCASGSAPRYRNVAMIRANNVCTYMRTTAQDCEQMTAQGLQAFFIIDQQIVCHFKGKKHNRERALTSTKSVPCALNMKSSCRI